MALLARQALLEPAVLLDLRVLQVRLALQDQLALVVLLVRLDQPGQQVL